MVLTELTLERIATGIKGLDDVIHGGFPGYSINLIAGNPGSGKTILTQHIMFNNAKNIKSLYLTTISEPQIKVIRYQQQFAFFNYQDFMTNVIYRDIGSVLNDQGIEKTLALIEELVKKHKPKIITIDSFKAIGDILISEKEFRDFINQLNIRLSLWECTVFLVGEYTEAEIQQRPEAPIVDGIIYLYGMEEEKYQKRYLRVLKMRGSKFKSGRHLIDISRDGINVYPRLNPVVAEQVYLISHDCQPTGVPGLDKMLNGGIPIGTTTLLAGNTGTGKSLIALKWLLNGAREKEPGLLLSFEESPLQIINDVSSFGWKPQDYIEQDLLKIINLSPIEVDLDKIAYSIQELLNQIDIKRIVIDSISAFEIGMNDKYKFTNYIWSLADYLKKRGISLILVTEEENFFRLNNNSHNKISYISDNIIFIEYFREQFIIKKLIGVLKMRKSNHEKDLRELIISEKGPVVYETRFVPNRRESK
jgi:circadian clock protein KaiC